MTPVLRHYCGCGREVTRGGARLMPTAHQLVLACRRCAFQSWFDRVLDITPRVLMLVVLVASLVYEGVQYGGSGVSSALLVYLVALPAVVYLERLRRRHHG